MIKSELVSKITDKYPELYQRDADLIVNTILNEISEALARGDRVEIRGFGLNSPEFSRHPLSLFFAVARSRWATSCRFLHVCVLGYKTSQYNRIYPFWLRPAFCKACGEPALA